MPLDACVDTPVLCPRLAEWGDGRACCGGSVVARAARGGRPRSPFASCFSPTVMGLFVVLVTSLPLRGAGLVCRLFGGDPSQPGAREVGSVPLPGGLLAPVGLSSVTPPFVWSAAPVNSGCVSICGEHAVESGESTRIELCRLRPVRDDGEAPEYRCRLARVLSTSTGSGATTTVTEFDLPRLALGCEESEGLGERGRPVLARALGSALPPPPGRRLSFLPLPFPLAVPAGGERCCSASEGSFAFVVLAGSVAALLAPGAAVEPSARGDTGAVATGVGD